MSESVSFPYPDLLDGHAYHPVVSDVQICETHISWVLLAGEFAYKIKKPIATPFLDYRTLELRKEQCQKELECNREHASDLYVDVVAVIQDGSRVRFSSVEGKGVSVVDYAVRMHRFPDRALLKTMLDDGKLREEHILQLAESLANIHMHAPMASATDPWARPDRLLADAMENFVELRALLKRRSLEQVESLAAWTQQRYLELHVHFQARRLNGNVRACHGDLHLSNLVLYRDRVTLFDAIEFNESFRWIDTANDLAFVWMDLEYHGRFDLANRFLNRYLECTGDYALIPILKWYGVYRAMVRAKVAAIRADQATEHSEKDRMWLEATEHLRLGEAFAKESRAGLVLTGGLSGSGKTYGTHSVLGLDGILRIRSDVERKRLFPSSATAKVSPTESGIYDSASTEATYHHLLASAQAILEGGFWAVVDATFLQRRQRAPFVSLAKQRHVPCYLVWFEATEEARAERIQERMRAGEDASDATMEVVAWQRTRCELPGAEEGLLIVDPTELDRIFASS